MSAQARVRAGTAAGPAAAQARSAAPERSPIPSWPPGRAGRIALALLLALLALAGNRFNVSLFFGVEILFGSIAALLAVVWLGTWAGVLVAVLGGAYTLALWDHPYAIVVFAAEAAAVGWHRDRARRRGLAPPPLAVSAALYWVAAGIPLVLVFYRAGLGLDWPQTLLIALKQPLNGILNAALAGLILVGVATLRGRRREVPISQVLFSAMLAGALLPSLLLAVWQNRDIRDRLEADLANRLALFEPLAVRRLEGPRGGRGPDGARLKAELDDLGRILARALPADTDPRVRLAPAPAWATDWSEIPTATPGLRLSVPRTPSASRMGRWRQARYRMEIAGIPGVPGGALDLDFAAAPLIDRLQASVARLLGVLLAFALIAVPIAHRVSRWLVRPLQRLAEATRALPAAVRDGRCPPAPVPGLFAETGQLADAVQEMAGSLAAGYRALEAEKERYRLVADNLEDLIVRTDAQGRFQYVSPSYCATFGLAESALLGQHYMPLVHPDDQAATALAVASLLRPPHTCRIDQRARTKAGWRWLQWSDRALLDDAGQVIGILGVGRDITERKAAELALAEERRRLSNVIAGTRVGTWEWEIPTGVTVFNERWAQMIGYRLDELSPTSIETWFGLAHPDDLGRSRTLLERHFAGEDDSYECELRMRHKDGRWIWVLDQGRVVERDAADNPLLMSGIRQDISERYLTQERLRESEARLSAIFDTAPIGIGVLTLDRRLALANRALGTLLGRDAATLRETRLDALTHPDDRERALAAFADLAAGRTAGFRITQRFVREDGRAVWGDLRVALLPGRPGEPPSPLGMVEDVTELHAANAQRALLEEALGRYTAQLEELVDLVNLPLPPPGQVQALLRMGCQSLGLPAAILGSVEDGRHHRVLAAVRDDDPEGPLPLLGRRVLAEAMGRHGRPCVVGPERLPGATVAAGFCACIALAFDTPRPGGPPDTLLLTLWSPEPSLELGGPERQILRLIAQRVAAVRHEERIQRDLAVAKERETIGHLASGVAHDFNNLLGVIDANLYYLEAGLTQDQADPEVRQVLEETQSALGQAKVIASGMLSLSRAGGVPLEAVDLERTVAELSRILCHVLPATVRLVVRVPAGLRPQSNGAFLQAALLNLALNARDAMPDGGELAIAARRRVWAGAAPLAVGTLDPGEYVEVSVSDSGCGMAPEILAHIFDPLFSTKAGQRGHGLGLFMVQELVVRSGAGLAVESRPGAGTRFRLLLPLGTPARETGVPPDPRDRPAAAPPERPLAGLRVLVVDDDPRVRDAVGRLLAMEGIVCASAREGADCLAVLARDPDFDLVLSDIAMPVLDGIGLLRALRREHPRLPVILMTGQDSALTLADDLALSPQVLHKPVHPGALRAAIRTATRAAPGAAPPGRGAEPPPPG